MQQASAARLPDGRLHLHHGPIDIVLTVEGPGRADAERAAARRFAGVLEELVEELPRLRTPLRPPPAPHPRPISRFHGPVARRMAAAAARFQSVFVTPMAAVAGAVADEIAGEIAAAPGVLKAVVNNGGDIAVVLSPGQSAKIALGPDGAGDLTLTAAAPWRGVATSGWRGRSHSLGIADAVTVVAKTAALADIAATLIANAVDLPAHDAITRAPASDLAPDSDLGDRLVTTGVAPLSAADAADALDRGAAEARRLIAAIPGIAAGALFLNGASRHVAQTEKAVAHA